MSCGARRVSTAMNRGMRTSGLCWWPADYTIGVDPSSGADRQVQAYTQFADAIREHFVITGSVTLPRIREHFVVTKPGLLPPIYGRVEGAGYWGLDARKATYHPQPSVVVCLALGYTLWFSLDHPTTALAHTAFYYY
jgi:hypothetical protein